MNFLLVSLIHEIFHIIGIVGTSVFGVRLIQDDKGTPPNVYIGRHGIEKYKSVLHVNGLDNEKIVYLPIENNFGAGTQRSHLEEGFDDNNNLLIIVPRHPNRKNMIIHDLMYQCKRFRGFKRHEKLIKSYFT